MYICCTRHIHYLRSVMAKFRLSCHSLAIETGQYARPPLPPEEIVCHICNIMEDEKHFLLNCTTTQSPEYKSFLRVCEQIIENFNQLTTDFKFSSIMSCHHFDVVSHSTVVLRILEREYRDCIKSRRHKIRITRHNVMMHQVLYNVHVTLFIGQLHNI